MAMHVDAAATRTVAARTVQREVDGVIFLVSIFADCEAGNYAG